MLSPSQAVFDYFVEQPEGTQLTLLQIFNGLRAFPKSHIEGAVSLLKITRRLKLAKGAYALVEGARRPLFQQHSIDYHGTSSRGYEAIEMKMKMNSKFLER